MGILAPLFFLGLGALAVPALLHLVRRTPKGRQEFSSLMFLQPTPPRLTRRSRLDQIVLLLLRLAALGLLVFAFTRPFLRESTLLTISELPKRRVAILIDNSASMRRADLWHQAMKEANDQLDGLAPHDDVALYAFAERLQTVAPFPGDNLAETESAVDVVRSELRSLQPTWQAGNLGVALAALAGELDIARDVQQTSAEPQIVVISDFQKGTRLEALSALEWPQRVRVITRPVTTKNNTNASVQLLTQREESEESEPRVRVVNAADSKGDQFYISWAATHSSGKPAEVAVYVPPGESRVIKLPRNSDGLPADHIVLRGDDQEFDNTFYVVPPRKQEVALLYVGNDAADDPQGEQYYLQIATAGDPLRQVTIREWSADQQQDLSAQHVQLVVVTRKLTAAEQSALQELVEAGSTALLVLTDAAATENAAAFLADLKIETAPEQHEGDFSLLGEIDFTHPLFAPLSGPRYNDFTKIHFWRHHALSLQPEASSRVIARFDDNQPWLVETSLGEGRVLLATSSWSPEDSQLAVSSKFVPLVGNLLDLACGSTKPLEGVLVGSGVPLAKAEVVTTPSGAQIPWDEKETNFTQTDEPGIYQYGSNESPQAFAVNLPPSESDTAPLPLEQLDQLGVRRTVEVSQEERLSQMRQERDTELEGRQKIWRFLLVGCLLVLIGETWWAGQAARPAANNPEVSA